MSWSEQDIPQRVAIVRREYERMAEELYPDGVPMEAYKTDSVRYGVWQVYLHFVDLLGKVLEK